MLDRQPEHCIHQANALAVGSLGPGAKAKPSRIFGWVVVGSALLGVVGGPVKTQQLASRHSHTTRITESTNPEYLWISLCLECGAKGITTRKSCYFLPLDVACG